MRYLRNLGSNGLEYLQVYVNNSKNHANPIQGGINPKDNHAVAGINVDEVAVIAKKHLGATNLLNAKKMTEEFTAINKVLDEFDVSRHSTRENVFADATMNRTRSKHAAVGGQTLPECRPGWPGPGSQG